MPELRPPLPPPLSHSDIRFINGADRSNQISERDLREIAAALSAALPADDFEVAEDGRIIFSPSAQTSAWSIAGRLEGIARGLK